MYIILSASKSQDFSRNFDLKLDSKKTEFLKETKELHKILKNLSEKDLEKLMKISPKLAKLNFDRFQEWDDDFFGRKVERSEGALLGEQKDYNFSPAIFAFTGDVYGGFDLENWKKSDFNFAQKHLGILSGFYGLISPLDFIKPYRLEMGTKIYFEVNEKKYKNLYDFWKEKITKNISDILKKDKVNGEVREGALGQQILINLASVEYSKSINKKKLSEKIKIVDIEFKIQKKDKLSIIAIYAKKGRGEMANWIIKNKIKNIQDLEKFSEFGWKFSKKESEENKLVFIKKM